MTDPMPDLVIQIKKKTDGSAALSCGRADGSVTWQRQEGTQGRFFPLHDLTHYAVETVLGYARGFYGMVAELIVGFLDGERGEGAEWSAEEFNANAATYYAEHGLSGACEISGEQLREIRRKRRELFARWAALPAGATLELPFIRTATAA